MILPLAEPLRLAQARELKKRNEELERRLQEEQAQKLEAMAVWI